MELGDGRERVPEIIGDVARSMTRFYLEPENQAYLFGCMAGAVISGHTRMKMIPALMFIFGCGLAARGAWSLADDIRSDLRCLSTITSPNS